MTPAVLLMGPTASGKSAVALELAARLPVEIVSVDSAQVYRGMDIGTAKPDARRRARACAHHLLDLIDPDQAYSAARFRADALAAIADIRARGRIPLLVGGTMLYFKALREGLSDLPPADAAVRARLEARAADEGWPALHAELARVDPATAARLDPTDSQRIQRALEVHELSGRPMSALQGARRRAGRRGPASPLALIPHDRALLHRRIAARFDAMLAAGLVDELSGLRQRFRLAASMPSMRCVGYRQAWQFIDGDGDRERLRERGDRRDAPAREAAVDVAALARAADLRCGQPAGRLATSPAGWASRGSPPEATMAPRAGLSPRCCCAIIQGSRTRLRTAVAMTARTLYDKLWDSHVVRRESDGTALLYIDRHLVHEVTSPQAFEGLKLAGRKPWRVGSIVATADHNTPTQHWDRGIEDPDLARPGRRARRQHARSTARRRIFRSATGARASCT